MGKQILENFDGITVEEFKKVLEKYPNNMKITMKALTEHFPILIIEEGEYYIWCNGVPKEKAPCLRIIL